MSQISVKICGLTQPADVDAVVAAGAAYCGLVFFEKFPRYVNFDQAAALALLAPLGLAKVALVVNADDAYLDHLTSAVPFDMLQLHNAKVIMFGYKRDVKLTITIGTC